MCGRFTLRTPAHQLAEHFQLPLFADEPLRPRYNIAPSQEVLAVCVDGDGRRHWARLRWGLIPHWAQDASIGNRTINARSETAAEKPAFRQSFAQRRCLIAADGFYEWSAAGPARRGYFIHRPDDAPLALAGLWDQWNKASPSIASCTVLTTSANECLRPLHDRMPVILEPENYAAWLDPRSQTAQQLATLLRPLANDALTYYAVGKLVNSPANDTPDCLRPLEEAPAEAERRAPAKRRPGGRRHKPDAGQGWLPLEP